MKMEQEECSETSAYKIQTPGNHPKESIQHSGHGEKFEIKNRLNKVLSLWFIIKSITPVILCFPRHETKN